MNDGSDAIYLNSIEFDSIAISTWIAKHNGFEMHVGLGDKKLEIRQHYDPYLIAKLHLDTNLFPIKIDPNNTLSVNYLRVAPDAYAPYDCVSGHPKTEAKGNFSLIFSNSQKIDLKLKGFIQQMYCGKNQSSISKNHIKTAIDLNRSFRANGQRAYSTKLR